WIATWSARPVAQMSWDARTATRPQRISCRYSACGTSTTCREPNGCEHLLRTGQRQQRLLPINRIPYKLPPAKMRRSKTVITIALPEDALNELLEVAGSLELDDH